MLGVSWLILTPLCLWNLLQRRNADPADERHGAGLAGGGHDLGRFGRPGSRTDPDRRVPASQGSSGFCGPCREGGPSAASCPTRLPAPERARLARHQGTLRSVTLFWRARTDECDTATVVLRHRNRAIKVWMHEGSMKRRPTDARTLPVSVAGGVASMKVPLAPPLPGMGAFRAIDGRSGRPIALS